MTNLCYGIPDINLPKVDGGEINPSAFAGHELVIFFCPSDGHAAAAEIEDYCSRARAFADGGAWLIGVLSGKPPAEQCGSGESAHITLAQDKNGTAWAAFEDLLSAEKRSEEVHGGTFFFERGGCLANAWPGSGHAEDALKALQWRT